MAILRYIVEVKNRCDSEGGSIASVWQYEETYDPHQPGKILTREAAEKKIKSKGLVLVHSNKHGQIWDSPDEPLLEEYQGTFSHINF